MWFAVELRCRVALFPLPTLFITAISRSKVTERQKCINYMFAVLVPMLEKAQYEYNAVFVANEPSNMTHDLSGAASKENVMLHFRRVEDIKEFVKNLSSGYRQ